MLSDDAVGTAKLIVFCTLYRVGNRDEPYHGRTMSTIKTLYQIKILEK